jgi:hypothetical protein
MGEEQEEDGSHFLLELLLGHIGWIQVSIKLLKKANCHGIDGIIGKINIHTNIQILN